MNDTRIDKFKHVQEKTDRTVIAMCNTTTYFSRTIVRP